MSSNKKTGVQLKVVEALQDDAYKGIARIDSEIMRELGIKRGDVVSIKGSRETVAIADRAYPADVGEGIIRIDGILRRNARAGIGDVVSVSKTEIKEAKKVMIAPGQKGIMVQGDPESLKRGLLGRAVVKGDILVLGGVQRRRDVFSEMGMDEEFGGLFGNMLNDMGMGNLGGGGITQIRFVVVSTNPNQPCIITENTEVSLNPKAVEVSDEKIPEITYEDIGGLSEEIKKIREMVEIPLKHPEIFEKLGIDPPKGVLLHGPPGTGKTLLAKAVANESEANFILLNGPEIMCVSGDTQILTNPKGYVKAESIYNESGESEAFRNYHLKKLTTPISTYSFKEGKIEKAHITHVTKLDAEAYNLNLGDGNNIIASENQPFLVYRNGDLVWESVKNIKEGDFVARLNKLNLPEKSFEIPLEKLKEQLDLVEKEGKFSINSKNLSRSNFIILPSKTSPELLELIGLVVSDGNIASKGDSIGFYNKDMDLIENFKHLFKKVFGYSNFKDKKQGNLNGVIVYSKLLVEYFKLLGLTNENKERIPSYFFSLPRSEIQGFIRGYFDGDGTVSRLKIKNLIFPTPILYSVNREFLMQLQSLMLLKLGIQCKLKEHRTSKGIMQKLVVRGNEGRLKFLDIGAVSKHKNEKLQEIKEVIRVKEHENIPHPSILIESLRANLPYKKYRNKDYYVYKTGNATKHSLNVLYKIAAENNLVSESIQKEFDLLMREDIGWEKVERIENCGRKELFDFTVDKDSFTASPYFILHNSKFYGESEKKIRDIFEEAEKTAPAIIFIDEIDAIAPKREEVTGEVERRVVSQLLTMMDGLNSRGKVVVIGATNRVNALDSALRRPGRFDREIIINVPDKKGRKTILNIHTRGMPLIPSFKKNYVSNKINAVEFVLKGLNEDLKKLKGEGESKKDIERNIKENKETLARLNFILEKLTDDEAKNESVLKNLSSKEGEEMTSLCLDGMIEEIASVTHGFVGADLNALTKEAAMNVLRKFLPKMNLDAEESIPQEILEKLIVSQEDFMDALRVVRPSAMREVLVETPNITWESVGGLEKVKQELREAVEWPLKYSDSFERLGIKPSKGILLYGPPGTGKTLLAKAVAKQSEANFIQIKGPSLLSMWVGKSLPYDEELIVREKGIVKRMKIGDIVKNKLNVQVLAFDKDKRVSFTRISDYIEHKLDSKLMEVTTRTGRKIKVTDYHSLFSFVNGEFVSVPTNQLIPNESYIAIPKNLNLPREEINEINLYDYFKKDENISVSNVRDYLGRAKKVIGLDKTSRILNVSKKYLADIIHKNLPVGIIEFDKLTNESKLFVDFKEIRIKLKSSKHDYPVIFKVNKDFWRLVGLWIAEGDFNSDSVRIHNQNPQIREDIRNICEEYGFTISEMETCVTINSYFLQEVLKNVFGLVKGAESKRLPTLSFVLDKESKANLLKGYFSGDGSIYSAERGKFKIEASTISKELANDLLYLLLDFGIVATCYTRDSKIYNNQVYRISILGVKNFERFGEIGFIDKKRNDRILQYVRSRKWARSDLIPLSGELYELASSSASVYSTNQSIGKESLRNMLVLVDKDKTKYKEYWDLVEGDLYLDLVIGIKEIDHEEYVYDISVSRDQNFVGGFGGVFAHNSEEGVRKIFERARQVAPCVIFFDEIDSLAGRRGHESGTKVTERVLNQILAEMDGLEDLKDILIIGATNRPDMLDPAILRPGRFDKILLINAPEEIGRKQILGIHTRKMPLAKDVDLDDLSKRTEGYTGADLEGFTREAALLALRESMESKQVKKKHFEEALKKMRPSVSKSTTESYKKLEENFIRVAKSGLADGNSYLG